MVTNCRSVAPSDGHSEHQEEAGKEEFLHVEGCFMD